MNILYVTIDFPPKFGGIGEYITGLCEELRQDEVMVIAPKPVWEGDEVFRFVVRRVNPLSKFLFWPRWRPLYWSVCRTIREFKPDIIIAAQPVISGQAVAKAAKKYSIPYAVNVHGMDIGVPARTQNREFKKVKEVLQKSSLITVNSLATKKLLTPYQVQETNIALVYPGTLWEEGDTMLPYQKEALLSEFQIPIGSKIILSVGRLVERKGMDVLIRAFAEILTQEPDAFLAIVGSGPEESRLIDLINKHAVGHRARIFSNVSQKNLKKLYSVSSVFSLLPRELSDGDIEGFGIVFLEANIMGLPVVAGRSGGVIEAVEDGKNGFLVDPINSTEVAEKILYLIDNKEISSQLATYGKLRIAQEYNYRIQAAHLREALINVIHAYEKN